MTRQELLTRVELDRDDALKRGWLTALLGVALILGGAWYLSQKGSSSGPVLALVAGGTVILMALARQLAPKPSYSGGRLEVRRAPIGWLLTPAAAATAVAAFVYSLHTTMGGPLQRALLIGASALVFVFLLTNWLLTLGSAPIVVVDGQGFHDRRATREPVPWDGLEPVQQQWVRNQVYYRLKPKDLSRLNLFARLNALIGFSGFALNGVGLDHGEGDMLLAIQAFRPDLVETL